ncbi:MAG: rhodanese-like domain-containing protein [Undibacterium sp.]|uniref:sulfurtransferase n=1 Tax=Undibacterium sp. TaxID=1914977 RepID=UPI002720CDE2|nr:rhodanese-like domain-containing protein [Undibacterium sp.]MDO8650615.1 rhodanese-like domain-containing protein [Undibacterium sp.]
MRNLFKGFALAITFSAVTNTVFAAIFPGTVIDSAWLAANLDKVQVVDVRGNIKSFVGKPEFETDAKTGKKTLSEVGGHLSGARLIDMKTMRTDRMFGDQKVKYMIPEKADFEKTIQSAGIDAGKPIVLVSVGTEVTEVDDALRVYWQFKVYGEDDIAVLDGGMANWLLEGREFTSAAASAKTGNWLAKTDRSAQYFASSEDVVKAIADKKTNLIDSRDSKHFLGLVKRDYVSGYGHLEGAKLYPTELMFKSAGGAVKFMSTNTYKALMSAQGIDTAMPSISYCNSGHLSSGPWFIVSELLGNKSSKLYDGSLHQWTLEKRAVVGAVPLN